MEIGCGKEGGGGGGGGGWVLAEKERKALVATRFVTTADFVTNEVVTNREGIVTFVFTWIPVHMILCV